MCSGHGCAGDHGDLDGLSDDDHSQYFLLTGRAGGQIASGGNAANEVLTLRGTSHATVATARVDIQDSALRMATAGKQIQDSGGNDRILLATATPHVDVTGGVRIQDTTATAAILIARNTGSVAGQIAIIADVGGSTAAGATSIVGVAGRAFATHASTTASFGLDYLAGISGQSVAESAAIRAQIFASGSGKSITNARALLAKNPSLLLATVTTYRHLDLEAISVGTNRQPINEAGSTTGDSSGNAFRSNTQFGSTTRSFGGGNGVIGVADAAGNPSSNPTAGFVMWSQGGLPKFRTSGGVVITLQQSAAYTPTNVTTDRSYDANATTVDELADVLGTLIADLQATGLLA